VSRTLAVVFVPLVATACAVDRVSPDAASMTGDAAAPLDAEAPEADAAALDATGCAIRGTLTSSLAPSAWMEPRDPAVVLWLDARTLSASSTVWRDGSGHANHAYLNDATDLDCARTFQPILSSSCAHGQLCGPHLDGTGRQHLCVPSSPDFDWGQQGTMVIVVATVDSIPSDGSALLFSRTTASATAGYQMILLGPHETPESALVGSFGSASSSFPEALCLWPRPRMYGLQTHPYYHELTLVIDGWNPTPEYPMNFGELLRVAHAPLFIGGSPFVQAQPFSGTIFAVLVFHRALGMRQVGWIWTYLQSVYAL
jgi:hypothetical protein